MKKTVDSISSTPKATKPRAVDAEILKLKTEHAEKVKALKHSRTSAKVLASILNKVPKLFEFHREALLDHLIGITTRSLATLPQPSAFRTTDNIKDY